MDDLLKIIGEFRETRIRAECNTCECYQGFFEQLYDDFGTVVETEVKKYKVEDSELHCCLGCNPCPPGAYYTDYLRKKSENEQK